MECDNCGKPVGFAAWKKGLPETYSFSCQTCGREYCAECLKNEPTYNPDGEYDERGPRDLSTMPTCRFCNARNGHIDDCGVWVGERCNCMMRESHYDTTSERDFDRLV